MNDVPNQTSRHTLTKVPAVTLGFWVIKILATTLGETGGDTVTMTLNWGYAAGVILFGVALVALAAAQILVKRFHATLYWATIVASTTFGTTLADFADRSLGIGYTGGSALLALCLAATLGVWGWSGGTIDVNTVNMPKVEAFYWAAITFSQTLGTALGDWLADTGGAGYGGGAPVFWAGPGVGVGLLFTTQVSPAGAAAGRPRRRLPRQAGRRWRHGAEPAAGLGRDRRLHHHLPAGAAAARR